jgi:dTMP kinase
VDTGMTRSPLAGDGIRRAKEGNNLGRVTQALFYATDFVDRLENEIVPALRAGFIVLTDRYIYSLMARAIVRGMDPRWIRSIYSVALKPDAVFYLRIGIEQLLPRVVFSRGFDYWESGMDLYPGDDMFDSFCNYQNALLTEFDRLSSEFNFQMVDAASDARTVSTQLKQNILQLLERDSRKSFLARLEYEAAATRPSVPQEKPLVRAASLADAGIFTVASTATAPSTNGNGNGNGYHATDRRLGN